MVKSFLAGMALAFTLMAVSAVAQNTLDLKNYGVNYVLALAAVSPTGKSVLIQADEDGRVICSPR
jgi:glutaminase